MTLAEIKYAIIKNKLKFITIKNSKDLKCGRIDAGSPEIAAQEFEDFVGAIQARFYKLEGNTSPSANNDSLFHLDYISDKTQVQGVQEFQPLRNVDTVDLQGVKDQIKKEIQAEYELKEKYREFEESKKDLKKKHEDLETIGGRVMMIIELIGPSIMQKILAMFAPQLEGMMSPATANLQGAPSEVPKPQTIGLSNMSDQDKIDEAFRLFGVVGITPDQLLEFAKILEAKPGLVSMLPMLKNF